MIMQYETIILELLSRIKKLEDDVSELIDKYSTYSEDELMREFLTESKRKKDRKILSFNFSLLFRFQRHTQKCTRNKP